MSLIRSKGDKMLFTTPRRPRKLHLKLLEYTVLHLDWQLAAQRQQTQPPPLDVSRPMGDRLLHSEQCIGTCMIVLLCCQNLNH